MLKLILAPKIHLSAVYTVTISQVFLDGILCSLILCYLILYTIPCYLILRLYCLLLRVCLLGHS